jgi:hypothetical protein
LQQNFSKVLRPHRWSMGRFTTSLSQGQQERAFELLRRWLLRSAETGFLIDSDKTERGGPSRGHLPEAISKSEKKIASVASSRNRELRVRSSVWEVSGANSVTRSTARDRFRNIRLKRLHSSWVYSIFCKRISEFNQNIEISI